MFDIFMYAINAVLPIILLIILGYALKTSGFFGADFLKTANKLVFRVCLPAMLFYNVYHISNLGAIRWDVVGYCLVIIAVLFALGLFTVLFFVKDKKQKGVILQCVFRSNFAIIGLPLSESLGGAEGAAIAAILSAFTIPLYNILAVISLSVFVTESGAKLDGRDILKKIIKNPLIIGVCCGLVSLLVRSLLPVNADGNPVFSISDSLGFLYTAIGNLSRIASPLALLVLGGQFEFSAVKGMLKEIAIGTVWRIVLAPVIGIVAAAVLCRFGVLQFDTTVYPALVALFGSPVAVSSAIMAGEMDNDEQLAGQLVVWTSVGSMFTTFIMVFAMKYAGLL